MKSDAEFHSQKQLKESNKPFYQQKKTEPYESKKWLELLLQRRRIHEFLPSSSFYPLVGSLNKSLLSYVFFLGSFPGGNNTDGLHTILVLTILSSVFLSRLCSLQSPSRSSLHKDRLVLTDTSRTPVHQHYILSLCFIAFEDVNG